MTTLIDYYGLPADFPGVSTLPDASPHQKVAHLEQAFAQDIGDARFLPYLMLHGFEAFLFVQPEFIVQTFAQRGAAERMFGNWKSFAWNVCDRESCQCSTARLEKVNAK